MMRRQLSVTVLAVLFAGGLAAAGTAQEAAGDAAGSMPTVVPTSQIGARAQGVTERLDEIAALRPTEALEEIEAQLRELEAAAASSAERLESLLAGPVTPVEVEDQAASWALLDGRFAALQARVGDQARALDDSLSEITVETELWKETRSQARSSRAPRPVLGEVERVLSALAASTRLVGDDLASALELLERVREARRGLRPSLERVETAKGELVAGLLRRQDEPVWRAIPSPDAILAAPDEVGGRLSAAWAELLQYVGDDPNPTLAQGLAFVLLAWFLSRMRVGRDRLHPERAGSAQDALRHPWAVSLLAAEQLMPLLHTVRLRGFVLVVSPLALAAWLRVLSRLLAPPLRRPLIGLGVLAYLELLRFVLYGVPVVHRSLLAANLAACLAGIVWLRRPERLQHLPWQAASSPWMRFLGAWMRLDAPVVAGGLLAVLLGYTALADRIALFAIWGTVLAGVWMALVRAGEAVVEQVVEQGGLAWLRMLLTSREAFLRVARRGLRGAGLLAWVHFTLGITGLWSPVVAGLASVLTASIGYGAVSLSLGGVLAFGLTLWISWLLARFTSFALDQEVFSRLRMPPGVPFALATFTRYAILVTGFVIAMAAIGFPIDRVTLLLSALGVGIGFGLQNVVNNFVSGAILLFERPIRVGDRVQIDELFGVVSTIGIRASKVRTFDGADVMVPNGDFISGRVTNWTFADRKRRIILPVGVAYGTKPRQVIELLEGVARSHPEVVDEPEPVVLFRGFGDSALNFEIRAFTEADWLEVMSDLAVATTEALEAAGITIPFPQRDLHLRNIPELRDALKEVAGASARDSDERSS